MPLFFDRAQCRPNGFEPFSSPGYEKQLTEMELPKKQQNGSIYCRVMLFQPELRGQKLYALEKNFCNSQLFFSFGLKFMQPGKGFDIRHIKSGINGVVRGVIPDLVLPDDH